MAGWHHGLDEHESEQAPGVGEEQGSLECCSPQGRKESDMTEPVNNELLHNKLYTFEVCNFMNFHTHTHTHETITIVK